MKYDQTLRKHEQQLITEMAYGYSHNATKITRQELIDKLLKLTDEDIPVMFTAVTAPKVPKTNPLGEVYKCSEVGGLVNVDYSKHKQAKLDVAAPGQKYVPGGATYGIHLSPAVVEHTLKKSGKVEHYIQILPDHSNSQRYVVRDNTGQFRMSTKQECAAVMPPPTLPQVTDIPLRRYKVDSIVAIELDGFSYEVTDVEPARAEVLKTLNSGSTPAPASAAAPKPAAAPAPKVCNTKTGERQ